MCNTVISIAVRRGRDPSAVAVLMEDSAAVAGVFLAGSALALTHYTGNVVYDAIGSITIGGMWLLRSTQQGDNCLCLQVCWGQWRSFSLREMEML